MSTKIETLFDDHKSKCVEVGLEGKYVSWVFKA